MAHSYQAGPILSPTAQQAISTYQLGTPQAEFKIGLNLHYLTRISTGVFVTGYFGVLVFAKGGSGNHLLIPILLLAALPGFVFLVYYVVDFLVHMSWRVYLCDQGILLMKSNQAEPYRWEQIQAMWQEVTTHYSQNGAYTTHKYTLQRLDGQKILFNDRFKNVEKLGNTLSEAITNFMLPRARASYKAGQVLNFGPISVSQQGVSNGKETFPWHEIKEFGVKRGYVSVRKEGKWLKWSTIAVAKIPNFFIFMALTRSILSERSLWRPR